MGAAFCSVLGNLALEKSFRESFADSFDDGEEINITAAAVLVRVARDTKVCDYTVFNARQRARQWSVFVTIQIVSLRLSPTAGVRSLEPILLDLLKTYTRALDVTANMPVGGIVKEPTSSVRYTIRNWDLLAQKPV